MDDCQFVGSLNVAAPYTGTKYGSSSFRDLNSLAVGYSTKMARDFFRDMLLRNVGHFPDKLDKQRITDEFDHFDQVFEQIDSSQDEGLTCSFVEEQPPRKLEVSSTVLSMIKNSRKNIRIIQPYVQNIAELEDLLVEAMTERGVEVEIISARNRDQPCYKNFLNSVLFDKLQKNGAKVYEEPYKYLHMKAIEVDDGEKMTVGSFN